MKFLIIVGLIFIFALLIINSVKKAIGKFISGFAASSGSTKSNQPADEVLFSKDDVVVLKGEAGEQQKNKHESTGIPR